MKVNSIIVLVLVPGSFALALPSFLGGGRNLEARQTTTLYVATSGSDSNAGTLAAPLKSIQKAVDLATPGTTIYIRGGTYSPTTNIKIGKSGTSSSPYTIRNYGTEKVIVDGEALTGTPAALGASLANEGSGTGNIVRGARLWDNVDDGLDFWMFTSPITVENSYAWGNGFNRWGFSDFQGDGNGFKLGGGNGATAVSHVVKNCISFDNAQGGFIDNTQKGSHTINRNTAWRNPSSGFDFEDSTPTISYNIAVSNNPNTKLSGGTKTGNSWQSGTWSDSSFISTDASTLKGPRNANGTVKGSNFLIPTSRAAIGATTWV
ncbi:hypothetical protein FRC03_005659 [Tulasnella sp. 419]|nr:hypothetical protein FRC03_005659 [Tulasnella sp. 419]